MIPNPYRFDVHHHVFPPGYVQALQHIGVTQTGGVPLLRRRVEQDLTVMDRQGIAIAITSISAPGVYFGDMALTRDLARQCNEFSAELVRAHPGRFGGFAILPLLDVDAAFDELRYALDAPHLDGVALMTSVAGRYLADPTYEPRLSELDCRAVPAFVHPRCQ